MEKKIIKIICDRLLLKNVTTQSVLADLVQNETIDIIAIIMDLEEKFHIDIFDEDIDKFKTVQNLIDYIKVTKKVN